MRFLPWSVLALALFLIPGCGDSGPSQPPASKDPVPGWLQVRLNSSNGDDGGVLFTVRGGPVATVRSSYQDLFTATVDSTSVRILVAGDLASGMVIAELQVPDVESVSRYVATVEEVAASVTFQQRLPSSVSLTVEKGL